MVAIASVTLVLFMTVVGATEAKKQGMCVLGKLSCSKNQTQLRTTNLKLVDKDRGNSDDVMAEGKATEDGFFELCGTASDIWGDIDPVFKIYTKCNMPSDSDPNCFRRLKFKIDKEWINKNLEFEEEIDLVKATADEDTRCFTGSAIRDYYLKLKNSFGRKK